MGRAKMTRAKMGRAKIDPKLFTVDITNDCWVLFQQNKCISIIPRSMRSLGTVFPRHCVLSALRPLGIVFARHCVPSALCSLGRCEPFDGAQINAGRRESGPKLEQLWLHDRCRAAAWALGKTGVRLCMLPNLLFTIFYLSFYFLFLFSLSLLCISLFILLCSLSLYSSCWAACSKK